MENVQPRKKIASRNQVSVYAWCLMLYWNALNYERKQREDFLKKAFFFSLQNRKRACCLFCCSTCNSFTRTYDYS